MMISPNGFIESFKNKSYKELLQVRDELMHEIWTFENHSYNPKLIMMHPSLEVVYQCNLKYLGELCKLIADKYNQEYVWGDTEESDSDQNDSDSRTYLDVIRDFLEQKGLLYDSYMLKEIKLRRDGKRYTLRDHVKGMIYSMLSAQTKWYRIENHLTEIKDCTTSSAER